MPFKDPAARRKYQRERKRRLRNSSPVATLKPPNGEKPPKGKGKKSTPSPSTPSPSTPQPPGDEVNEKVFADLHLSTAKSVLGLIEEQVNAVRKEPASPLEKARVLAYLGRTAMQALTASSVEERVEALEAIVESAQPSVEPESDAADGWLGFFARQDAEEEHPEIETGKQNEAEHDHEEGGGTAAA